MLKIVGDPPRYFEVSREWPPLILGLHGWARDRRDFSPAFHELRAASVDLPGFGLAPPPQAAWGTRQYAEFIIESIVEFGFPVVLVGHSFGGRIAVRIAAEAPALIRSLVLTGSPLVSRAAGKRLPPAAYRLIRTAHHHRLIGDGPMERARRRYGSPDYLASSGVMRDILVKVVSEDYVEDLSRVSAPTTLLWGAGDTEVPPVIAERIAAFIPATTIRLIDQVGHNVPLEAPEVLHEVLRGQTE